MTTPDSKKSSGWQGADPIRLLATLLVGGLLYFVLPSVARVPDAKIFAGTASAKAGALKAGDKAAKPGDKAAKPDAKSAKAETKPAEVKPEAPKAAVKPVVKKVLSAKELEAQKAEAEAKAKVEAAAKAKADAEAKVKAEAEAKTKAEAEKLRQADWIRGLHLFAIFVATIVGILFLHEQLFWFQPVGTGIVLLGSAISQNRLHWPARSR